LVASKLILHWSPEQISGSLKIQYPDDESMRVSHETIYRSLFIQARGVLKKELIGHLRSNRRIRRSRHASQSSLWRGGFTAFRSRLYLICQKSFATNETVIARTEVSVRMSFANNPNSCAGLYVTWSVRAFAESTYCARRRK
jgi:hypothetical protein